MPSRLARFGLIAALVLLLSTPLPGLQADEPDEIPLPPGLGEPAEPEETQDEPTPAERLPPGLHGFAEARLGPRIDNDSTHSEDYTVAEIRLQAEYARSWNSVTADAKGDLIFDGVTDEIDTDLRQLRLTFRPAGTVDLRLGRQIMTWGTGDLLFINDLFPKDWQSFFIGRDEEYLKAPSDSLRFGWFGSRLNLDLAYTPVFEPDRYIRGERISYFDPSTGSIVGDERPVLAETPDEAFTDDEIALRLYGSAGSFEIAGYAYRGFWKSPAGSDPVSMRATFPALDVFGASVRGPLGPGIGSAEIGYYDSRDDSDGGDPFVDNGELRTLVGYELELARELTGGFQYYLERLLDYDDYRAVLSGGEPREENRHVVTARLTKLMRQQTLIGSLFAYYSPSDRDGYVRPKLTYKLSDFWMLEAGFNLFFGDEDHTFFGQFEHNSNVYAAARFSL